MSDFLKPGDIFVNKITGVKYLVIEKDHDAKNYDGFSIWVLRKTEGVIRTDQYFAENTIYKYFVKAISPGKIWKELNEN